jgi:type I restriction enzyme S subunit
MKGEWTSIRLGDVCTKIGSGATPRGGSEVYLEQGPFALIRSQNVYNDGFHRDGLAYISEKHAEELEGVEVARNDVLLNITGDSVARACQVDPGVLPARVNQHVAIIRPDPEKLDPRFLRYVLVSPEMQAKLLSWAGAGGTRNALTKAMIESLEILAPKDIGEQRAIAHILGTLDDKIEVNRRMSQTLEATARALFESWFVRFDPVRRNMARKGRGQPSPAASRHPLPLGEGRGEGVVESHAFDHLFPARLVDSALSPIPEGWEVGKLGDVAVNPRRGVQPDCIAPDTPYIALEHMPRRCIALSDWGIAEAIESNKFEFKKSEILFGKLRPYFHKVGIAPVDGVCSTDIVVVCPRTPHWFAFVLGVVSSDDFVEFTNAGSTGTKMPRTSWTEMARYEIALPPEALAQAFTDIVRPRVDRIIAAIHESRTLAAVRDALLPKLISGEIRVKDAERILGRTTS